jgi:ribokinase
VRYVPPRPHRRGHTQGMEDGVLRRRTSDHAVESLRAALKSLRTRSGLTVERLRATELTLAALVDLDVVRQLERAHQLSPEEAIVAAVRGAAAQLDVDDMLIVDAALALGLVAESFPDADEVGALYAADLSERRAALVASWRSLHELLGAKHATRPPTVRALRTELESRAFERLGERILTVSPLDADPDEAPSLVVAEEGTRSRRRSPGANGTTARVVVVGAAVMDQIYAVDHLPEAGTAVQATAYQRQPGGKGLNLAVAAARLGMDAHLIAPVGDDDTGAQLIAYLESEGVQTDLVRTVPGATTPVAGVMVTPDGVNSTIGWMNAAEMSITDRDIGSRSVTSLLEGADAVMLSFSVAWETIEAVLETLGDSPQSQRRPTTILRPSPPYGGARFAHESLRYVDYLIGTHWELSCLLPGASPDTPPDTLLTQLLVQGARTVCIAEGFGCTVRSSRQSIDIPPPPIAVDEAPGARDAFAAALALRLHESDGQLDEAGVRWATAAMAVPQTLGGVANSMPSRDEIDRILRLTSSV